MDLSIADMRPKLYNVRVRHETLKAFIEEVKFEIKEHVGEQFDSLIEQIVEVRAERAALDAKMAAQSAKYRDGSATKIMIGRKTISPTPTKSLPKK